MKKCEQIFSFALILRLSFDHISSFLDGSDYSLRGWRFIRMLCIASFFPISNQHPPELLRPEKEIGRRITDSLYQIRIGHPIGTDNLHD